MRPLYHFGQLVKEIDYFAFPRTGSHFFRYCTAGLFDIVSMPHAHLENPEAIGRQLEIAPEVLYGLDLREDGAAHQPLWINTTANGVHGRPMNRGNPAILLIRDPIATAYSLYRVQRDRWKGLDGLSAEWLSQTLHGFSEFYHAGFDLLDVLGERCILIRYEALVDSAEPLERLVRFCGVNPKLRPDFVHFITRFEVFAKPGERTFYRAGDNLAWREDVGWVRTLGRIEPPDFSRFGY